MKPTRIGELLVLVVIAAVSSWILIRGFYGSIPPVPVYAGGSLYLVAAAEFVFALVIRSRVKNRQIGSGLRDLHPITVARAVALAKASALVGAVTSGIWVGALVYLVPQRSSLHAASADAPGAWVGLGAAVALVAAALWLERCCKAPEDTPGTPSL
ncbi:hypothetical protein ABH922_000093 [Rhodococcus sp. 27YEA15]|uniref:DUF3180 domain-containing protein n=1 Tax=Rhodococcus sp. 27YEA15 TaxID=3156259 RepID=UPI003C7B145F